MPRKLTYCSICHNATSGPFNLKHPMHAVMERESLCASCAAWYSYAHTKDCILLGHTAYLLIGKDPVKSCGEVRENRDRQFFYNTLTLKLFVADSICLGEVSSECRSLFKRTYLRPLGVESARRLVSFEGDKCRSKGCFDRYHCVLYDRAIERREGVWNRVPDNWIPGGEECPSFINKSTNTL